MAAKPTTIEKTDFTVGINPLTLPWPTDQYGFTTLFKREATRSIGRINGDAEKYAVFRETLRVILAYASEKFGEQKEFNIGRIESYADLNKAAEEAAEKYRLGSIERKRREIEHLESLAPKVAE